MLIFTLLRPLLFLLLAARLAAAEPVLDTIAEVRALSPEEAARSLPVRLDATVIYFDPASAPCLFIQDNTACTYVTYHRFVEPTKSPILWYSIMNLKPGDHVRIEGLADPGEFFPVIKEQRIERLGKGALPAPRKISEDELLSPALDSQWVEVPAVVTGVEKDEKYFAILVEVHGWKLKAMLPREAYSADRVATLMQRPARLQGVVGTIFNNERQMTGRYFFVPSFDQIIPTDAPTSGVPAPVRRGNQLLRSDDTAQTLARIGGVVTQVDGNDFYLRDASGSVLVRTARNITFPPGTRIEAEGFAATAPYRPIFRARKFTMIGTTTPPQPKTLDFSTKIISHFQNELVALDADLLAWHDEGDLIVLQCRMGDRFFEALLPQHAPLPKGLVPGDRIKLTGICELTTLRPLPLYWTVDGFRLHLPKTGGVVILHHARWWTLQHVLILLGIVFAVALAALAWVWLLRSRVKRQTKIIGSQIQHAAVMGERERIARDLHDTVEQELTGVSIHLDHISGKIADNIPVEIPGPNGEVLGKIHAMIEVTQKMLQHCRKEARTSIHDLRNIELEQRGLAGTLQELLPAAVQECGAKFELTVTGDPLPFETTVENHLLRIAQESVSNAAHHAAAREITVRLDYKSDSLALEIRDDGHGFDPAVPAPAGHFGLLGLRERVKKIHANLTLESAPGKGTTILVLVPFVKPS